MKKLKLVLALLLVASAASAQVLDPNGNTLSLCTQGPAGASPWLVGDGAGALNTIVDSGSLTCNAGTGTFTVGDGAGALNVIVDSGAVTVSDGAGALNTIVDSGTLTCTQGTGTNLHTVVDSGTVTVSDGAGALNVIVDSITAGDNNIGNVDVLTMPTTTVTATNLDVQIGGSDSLTIGTFPDNEPINVAQRGGVAVVAGACERESLLYVQISQTGGTQLITGTASERIYICSIQLVTATAQNIALVDGTGSVCATSPTGLLGGSTAATGWNFAANGGIVLPPSRDSWTKTSTDADNVCLLQSGAGQVSGSLTYVSIPNI